MRTERERLDRIDREVETLKEAVERLAEEMRTMRIEAQAWKKAAEAEAAKDAEAAPKTRKKTAKKAE